MIMAAMNHSVNVTILYLYIMLTDFSAVKTEKPLIII